MGILTSRKLGSHMPLMNRDLLARTATCQATVERCLAELRRGGAVALTDGPKAVLTIAAESAEEASLAWLGEAGGKDSLRLVLTTERARHLGMAGQLPANRDYLVCLLPAAVAADAVRQIADPTGDAGPAASLGIVVDEDVPPVLAEAAIGMMKTARLLPAAVLVGLSSASISDWVEDAFVLESAGLSAQKRGLAGMLRRVGSARVPLMDAERTEIIAFRPADGGKEHLAIVIGQPDPSQPVLARLHSECFTGDLLASLRCDCGEQLRGAIEAISLAGSGVLLYMAQEGRGIGLVNKLRAYQLQDAGSDTLEANLQLGFGADERVYQPAAEMLRQLGFSAVRLMTNNPEKVTGLEHCGIRVTERVPHIFPSNDHNAQYLVTKARRFGHMF